MVMMTIAIAASLTAQEKPADVMSSAPAKSGLSDLEALTRSCSMAALNAAARRAASVPTQGKYQFTYFNLVSDSHHGLYEVHFRSNYQGESELKYCVEIYCQQGWDPKTAKATITVLSNSPQREAVDPHTGGCGQMNMPAKASARPTNRARSR